MWYFYQPIHIKSNLCRCWQSNGRESQALEFVRLKPPPFIINFVFPAGWRNIKSTYYFFQVISSIFLVIVYRLYMTPGDKCSCLRETETYSVTSIGTVSPLMMDRTALWQNARWGSSSWLPPFQRGDHFDSVSKNLIVQWLIAFRLETHARKLADWLGDKSLRRLYTGGPSRDPHNPTGCSLQGTELWAINIGLSFVSHWRNVGLHFPYIVALCKEATIGFLRGAEAIVFCNKYFLSKDGYTYFIHQFLSYI